MHNIKEIRKDFNVFAKSLEKRAINIDFKNLQKLDEQNRELIQKKEALEKEKKDISKSNFTLFCIICVSLLEPLLSLLHSKYFSLFIIGHHIYRNRDFYSLSSLKYERETTNRSKE